MRRALLSILLVLLPALSGAQSFVRWIPPPNVASFYETDTQVVFTKPVVMPTGSTPLGQTLFPDGSASAPSIAFSNDTDLGFYRTGSNLLSVASSTAETHRFTTTGFYITSSAAYLQLGNTAVIQDATNAIGQRSGGTAGVPVPQTFNIYNFCDGAACATGYERLAITWSGNVANIWTEKAGTGASRTLRLGAEGSGQMIIGSGLVYPNNNDAITFGTAGLAWKDFYVSRSIQGSKTKTLTDASATAFVRIALPQTVGSNFTSGSILWQLHCDNGTATTYADRAGQTVFTCNNIAGTEACVFDSTAQQVTQAATYSFAAPTFTATGGTDTVDLNVNADCGGVAGPTNMYIHYRLDILDPQTVTPL